MSTSKGLLGSTLLLLNPFRIANVEMPIDKLIDTSIFLIAI
jgi:hypothetical protein